MSKHQSAADLIMVNQKCYYLICIEMQVWEDFCSMIIMNFTLSFRGNVHKLNHDYLPLTKTRAKSFCFFHTNSVSDLHTAFICCINNNNTSDDDVDDGGDDEQQQRQQRSTCQVFMWNPSCKGQPFDISKVEVFKK